MQLWPLIQKNFIYIKRNPKATFTTFIFPMMVIFIIFISAHINKDNYYFYTKRHQESTSTNMTFPNAHNKFHYFHDIAIVSKNHTVHQYIEYLLSHYSPGTNFAYYREPFENRNVTKQYDLVIEIIAEKDNLHFDIKGSNIFVNFYYNQKDNDLILIDNVNDYQEGFIEKVNFIYTLLTEFIINYFNLNLKPKTINLQIMKMSYNTLNNVSIYEKISMSIIPILYTMTYFPLFFQFVLWMVNEKEQKLKDLLFRQGVTIQTYFTSFQITFLLIVLLPILLSMYVLHTYMYFYLSYGVVFLFLFLFIFNFIAIGYLMQSLLSSSRTGQTLAKMFFISITILSAIVKQPECSNIPKMFFSLFPQMLFSISFEMLGMFNALGYKISLFNIEALFFKYHGYSLFKIIMLYVFDFCFYIGLALFIEELRLSKMDCLQYIKLKIRKYTKKQLQSSLVDFDMESDIAYSNNAHMRNGNDIITSKNKLTMKHLRKWYNNGDIKALNNFNCELYSGEIYVLLGHNGAGKSTLVKIISGMEDADKGDILLNNKSIIQNKRLLFQNIGLCSQEDFYFPELTVKEHLELMTKLKGKNVNKDEINNLMEMINMKGYLDMKASNLSGGQKRKLSISLALIGGSNLVLLDEPTSGMDYKSKKFIWDFLKKYKKDKIILLTTHSLEEAEYLHDYIGIMNEGEYVCSGTSEYLKSKYSSGVNINFILDSNKTSKANVVGFLKEIKQIEPNCLIKALSNELLILHLDNVNANLNTLMTLFNFISQYKHKYNIKNYNISTSSLEDVFLKINNNVSSKDLFDDIEKAINSNQQASPLVFIDTDVSQFDLSTKLIVKRNFFVELKSNLYRNYISLWRNKFNFIFEIISSLLIIAILLISLVSIINKYSSFKVTMPSLNTKLSDVYFNDFSHSNNNNNYISSYFKQMKYPEMKFLYTTNTNRDLTLLEPNEYDNMFYESSKYFTEKAVLILTHSTEKQDNLILLTRKDTPEEIILISNILFNLYLKNEYNINIKPSKRNDQIIRNVAQYIQTVSSFEQLIYIYALNLITIILVVMLLVNLSGFNIITPLKERLNNVKQLQFLSGANTIAYWASFLIVDTTKMIGFVLLLTPLLLIYLSNCLLYMIIFILCFIIVINLVVYLFSFYASKEEEGQQLYLYWMTIVTIILPFLGLFHFAVVSSKEEVPKEEEQFFHMIFNSFIIDLFPSSSLIVGLFKLWVCSIILEFDDSKHNDSQMARRIMSFSLRRHLLVSLIQFCVCVCALYMLETRMFDYINNYLLNKCASCAKQSMLQIYQTYRNRITSEDNNEYIKQEKEKITKETQGNNKNILTTKIENLSKTYYTLFSWKHNFIPAVQRLYLGLSKNEKFGLLGSNGSGKSTTFKCLINELLYEQGNITFFSHNSKEDFELIRQNTGYCPQENSLFDYLTVKETLMYYAQMKKVKTPVLELSTKFGLENYLNHQCIYLSGGNKRKLSFAIAIMNNPKIILLDEPSTGVDPQSRRIMWKNLSLISTHNISYNMILSTHSIEEAEILCDRIGWMEKGNFTCIGNPEELKTKFSDGYYCKIKFNINETCIINNSSSNEYLELKKNVLDINTIINEETKNGNIWRLNLLWNVINAIKDNCGSIKFISCDNDSTYTLNINLIEAQKGNVFAWLLYAKNEPQYEIKEFGFGLKPLEMVFDSMNSSIII